MLKVDIVGGSLSGLSSAIVLKEKLKDLEVVVHEKHKKIGFNRDGRSCGEGYTISKEWARWMPVEKSIFNKINQTITYVKNKRYTLKYEKNSAFTLNRQAFIDQLATQAKDLGVIIKTNDKIYSKDDLDCDYIIDASGCLSVIKKELGFKKGIRGITYQQTLENSNSFNKNTMEVFLTADSGYFWNFPRNPEKDEINLGMGMIFRKNKNIKNRLEEFKKKNNIKGDVNYEVGGLIPAGIQKPLVHKNILFVGDSGVGTFPLTGEGIYRALYSGELAAKAIISGKIKNYSKSIYNNFMKWDMLGKFFLKINNYFGNIGDNAVFFVWHKYLDWWYSFH